MARELRPPEQEVGGAQDHGHLIVRLVRHAAGQLAHDLEALALAGALLHLPPGGLVGVHLEHTLGPALGIAPQHPLRRDVEPAPVPGDVHELPLPPAVLQQQPIDLGQRRQEFGMQQLVRDLADGLRRGPPVQPHRARAPVADPAIEITHEGLRQVDHLAELVAARGFGGEQRPRAALRGDVALDRGDADYPAGLVPDRGDAERDGDPLAILPDPLGLGERDRLPAPDALEDLALAIVQLRRHERVDRTAHDLVRRVAEDLLRPSVPGDDRSIELLADDPVHRVRDDGREPLAGFLCADTIGNVLGDYGESLGRGIRCHLEPPAKRGIVGLFAYYAAAAHRPPIHLAERPVRAAGEGLPEVAPYHLGRTAADQRRRRGVHVCEHPAVVYHEERITDAGEDAFDPLRLPSGALRRLLCAKGLFLGTRGLLLRADGLLFGARGLRPRRAPAPRRPKPAPEAAPRPATRCLRR